LDINTGEQVFHKDVPSKDITIYNNKIYSSYFTTTYPENDLPQRHGKLVCVDPSSGNIIWEKEINNGGGAIYMPPICEDGVVYIGSNRYNPSGVQAFNAETGEEIWHTQIEGTVMFTDGLIVDALLIMNAGYYHIIALDKNTGEVKYIKFLSQNIVNGRLHYYKGYIYTTRFAWIYVIDPQTGEVVYKTHGGDGQSIYKISVGNDRVFCHGVPKLQCLEIYNPN
jgi:outer membrane protein assembly factor BamB